MEDPVLLACVCRVWMELMSTSRASASPLTHTKHSVLEKVRGHIVRIRRVLVLMLWKCTTTHTRTHTNAPNTTTHTHTHTKPLSMQVHGSNVSLTVRTRKKEKVYWDLSFFVACHGAEIMTHLRCVLIPGGLGFTVKEQGGRKTELSRWDYSAEKRKAEE